MAKNEFSRFNLANDYVINKDKAISYYIQYMLARTQSMFTYFGLPDTIPATNLEMMLQTKGYAFITKVDDKLYALYGGLGGEPSVYDDPTKITVANAALKLSKEFTLDTDGVLVNNDALRLGLLPLLNKYGALLAENIITMRTVDIILRMVCLISASDDKTYTSAEKFIRDIENGKISAVGESAFFEGVRIHSTTNSQNYLMQFIELEQYLKGSCFNEIGLNANYNMKRVHISSNESAMNDDFLLPLVDNMIKERQTAIEKINAMYGTEISIDYASAWKVTHEENEKQIAISESIADSVHEQAENGIDVAVEETDGAWDKNRPLIKIGDISGGREETISDTGTAERYEVPERPERKVISKPSRRNREPENKVQQDNIRDGETAGYTTNERTDSKADCEADNTPIDTEEPDDDRDKG